MGGGGSHYSWMLYNSEIDSGMKRLLILLTVILWIGQTDMIAQQTTDEASIRQKINTAASQLQSMECEFVQTKHLKMLNDKMVARGKMYYSQASKLRWEYASPYTYTFILNNTKVMMSKGDYNDVVDVNQSKVFREIARVMMNSVVGKCLDDKRDFQTDIIATGSEWVVTMIPVNKNIKQMFAQIVLHFDISRAMVYTVELLEKNGDRTVIELKNIITNQQIDETVFSVG